MSSASPAAFGVFAPGRVAVISGAASGIGYAVASACGRRGMRLALADVNAAALEEARAQLAADVGEAQVLAVQCDVSSDTSVLALKESVYGQWGEVSFLHLNAGVGGGSGPISAIRQKDWERNIGVNLYGVTNGLRHFVPAMQAQGTACAVAATASWAGLFNAATFSGVPYVVSKAGVVLLMEALQHELRRTEGCRLTAHVLCPGRVDTNMLVGMDANRNPPYAAQLRRISDPQERAKRSGELQQQLRRAAEGSMTPAEMAALLLEAVEAKRFYVLGYDDQQPLDWLKALAMLRAEDIVHERPPMSHRTPEGAQQRRILREAMERGPAARSRL